MIDLAPELAAALAPVLERLDAMADRLARIEAATPPRLLTVDEAARALGISPRSVWRRVQDGSLPSTRVGRCVRIDVCELAREARTDGPVTTRRRGQPRGARPAITDADVLAAAHLADAVLGP